MPEPHPILAEVVRNGTVESVHRGSLSIVDASGNVIHQLGEVTTPLFPRSVNKPLQAIGMLRAGVKLDGADLAIAAGSHFGEPRHVDRVTTMLASAGLDASVLQCPAGLPLTDEARDAVIRMGGNATPVMMTCSGKHAAMLLTCVHAGWDLASYLNPEHPLQLLLRQTVSDLAGEPVLKSGVDGCGAPLFALTLTGVARAFLRLVQAAPDSDERRVADAMRANPWFVGGTGATDTELMTALPGLVAKHGAEMVFAGAHPEHGACAFKIDDGSYRPMSAVAAAALRGLGLTGQVLAELATQPVYGGKQQVGEVRAVLEWER